jgi:hypothetical protein
VTITLKVYEADNSTFVDDIDPLQFKHARYAEINSELGGWEITFPNLVDTSPTNRTKIANPALALMEIGRVVRFLDDGQVRGAGRIEDRGKKVVAAEEEGGEVTVWKGPGLFGIFDKVCVRPDKGLGNLPWHTTRWFNFAADRLRDDDPAGPQGAWPFAYGQLPNYDTNNYFGRPEGFTDTAGPAGTGPEWLWEDDTRTAFADAGVCYFRQRFTLASETDCIFEFAADDEGELWVDDVPLCNTEGVYLGGCVKAGVRLSAGEHLIAALGRNLNALRAGVVYAGWSVSNGMPDTLLVRSDSDLARCLAYPADPPGFTPTEVPRLVVDEVQDLAEPRLADVTFSFIAASDTDSAEVVEVTDLTCDAPGDTIWTLFRAIGETYLDLGIGPDSLEMHAWIRGTRGSDLSATVELEKGNCRRVDHDEIGADRATVALVMGARFAPFEVEHADAATVGYEEIALDFGDASEATAERFATDYLNLVSQARKGISIELVPDVGPRPYEDFGIGDTISVPGIDGTPEDHRVVAIGMEVGPDSITRWTVDLDQPRLLLQERLSAIMRQLPGLAGGRTILPSPTRPQFVASDKGSEQSHTWQWDGPLGEIQLYKNGTAITGALVAAGSLDPGETAKTTVTNAARKYVKGVDKLTITAGGGAHSPDWVPPEGRWIQEIRATADSTDETITITVSVT